MMWSTARSWLGKGGRSVERGGGTQALVLRRGRWQFGVLALGAGVVAARAIVGVAVSRDQTHWWWLVWSCAVAAFFALFAVVCAVRWIRYRSVAAPLYADRRAVRLTDGGSTVELPWESLRAVDVAARPLGFAVSVQPADPDAATTQLRVGERWVAGLTGLRRRGGRLGVTIAPTRTRAEEVAGELRTLSADRCPVTMNP